MHVFSKDWWIKEQTDDTLWQETCPIQALKCNYEEDHFHTIPEHVKAFHILPHFPFFLPTLQMSPQSKCCFY